MIFPYLMSEGGYIEKFEIVKTDIIRSLRTFSSEVAPEIEYACCLDS